MGDKGIIAVIITLSQNHFRFACRLNQTRLSLFVRTINIQAAKTHLSRLVEEAAAGEDIVLAKAGRPMVRLVPFKPKTEKRKLGMFKGKIEEMPGCWDPDPDLESDFHDGPIFPSKSLRRDK